MLLIVDETARVVRGRLRPFSELGLHLRVYRHRSDAGAVLHAHPPHATARAATGHDLPCFLPEAVVSMGTHVPLVPFAAPGSAAEEAIEPYLADFDGLLLENHGVLTWGDDSEQAFLRMELIEHLAHMAWIAQSTGGIRPLPEPVVARLLKSRAAAGLGPGRSKA